MSDISELSPLERVQYKAHLEKVEVWSRDEACLYLGIDPSQLRQLSFRRRLPTVKGVSKENRFRRQDIIALIDECMSE